MSEKLLVGLNENQLKAVTSESKYISCLAGAGSGKTRVLTHRVAYLNDNRNSLSSMLCLTFTRLAGKEMKERVISLVGEREGRKLFCNTFHAFCVKVIKEYGYLLGYEKEFTVYDQDDREDIVKAIIGEFKYKIKPSDVLEVLECQSMDNDYPNEGQAYKAADEYNYRLKRNNAIDLDMLLVKTLELLKFAQVQQDYWNQYEYVFVDEFQDTNVVQMDIIRALNPRNLFVVGDDFQGIYGWRHADIRNILEFPDNYPGCEVIKLEDNYRSTHHIVEASNKLIKHNKKQSEKKLIAHKEGPEVTIFDAANEHDEMKYIIDEIAFAGDKFKDFAILSRTNNQLLNFVPLLDQRAIPYEIISNKNDIFKDPDIKNTLQLIELALNPKDDYIFSKVINFPLQRKGIVQLAVLEQMAISSSIYMYQIDDPVIRDFFKQLHKSLYGETAFIDNSATERFKSFVNGFKINETFFAQDLTTRVNKIEEALTQIEKWEAHQKELGEDNSIQAFMKWLRLKDIQEKLVEDKNKVKLMTVHASKGLEFNNVFVIGMNQDVFPSKRAEDREEERRLFYVAITRAREELYITRSRTVIPPWGKRKPIPTMPSQFIREMGEG